MRNRKILVTGGPVHAHIDAVKIVTNDFKGGRMAALADSLFEISRGDFSYGTPKAEIIYLCKKGSAEPHSEKITVLYHNGYDDYRDKILELAPDMDAVILGAAVANLIPENPWEGKFPSHNYSEGEVIHIPFIIAPRVINMVKAVAKPTCHLFGFKLLKGVPHDELIEAAYDIVLDSKATCVFANDRNDLDTKYAVTKERAVNKMNDLSYPLFIWERITDEYYSTKQLMSHSANDVDEKYEEGKALARKHSHRFKKVGDYVFGTVAVRCEKGFVTTGRGKQELDSWTYVESVDHEKRVINVFPVKATLNAPLLDNLFKLNPDVTAILHCHETGTNYKKLFYHPPGTVKDSLRDEYNYFEIEGHGVFELIRGNEDE